MYPSQTATLVSLLQRKCPDQPAPSILVSHPTGSGKTLNLLVAASLLGGITLAIVPLIALGADQAERPKGVEKVVAIQLDKIKRDRDALALVAKLKKRYKKENLPKSKRVILYASPEAIVDKDKPWNQFLIDIAAQGGLSLVAVDELHMVAFQGLAIREAFLQLDKDLFQALKIADPSIRWLFMTATITTSILKTIKTEWQGFSLTAQVWATPREMAKRKIKIQLACRSGHGFIKVHKANIQSDVENGFAIIIYSLKKSRLEKLTKFVSEVYKEVYGTIHDKHIVEIHGGLSVEDKSANMALFAGSTDDDLGKDCDVLNAVLTAADHGIDNPSVRSVYLESMAPSKTSQNQALGRVGRGDGAHQDGLVFNMMISVKDYCYLRTRISNQAPGARKFALEQLNEELHFCTIMTDCWHYALEKEFGRPGSDDCLPNDCGANCPRCSGSIEKQLSLTIVRENLKQYILQVLIRNGNMKLDHDFVDILTPEDPKQRLRLYGRKTVKVYQAEFLALQLIASGLVEAFEKLESVGEKKQYVTFVRLAWVGDALAIEDADKWKLVGKHEN